MTEFGVWITKLKKQPFNIVYSPLNSINLRYYIFTDINNQNNLFLIFESKFTNNENNEHINQMKEIFYDKNLNQAFNELNKNDIVRLKTMINIENKNINMNLINLIKKLYSNEFFPVVIFFNSKNECEKNSENLFKHISDYNEHLSTINKKLSITELRKKGYNKKIDFNSLKEKEDLKKEYHKILPKLFKDYQKLDIFRSYLELIKAGIGYYYNDMFPFFKVISRNIFLETIY